MVHLFICSPIFERADGILTELGRMIRTIGTQVRGLKTELWAESDSGLVEQTHTGETTEPGAKSLELIDYRLTQER